MRTTVPTPSKASGDLDLGPLPLVSGFMFLSPTSLCHGEFTSDVLLHKLSWASDSQAPHNSEISFSSADNTRLRFPRLLESPKSSSLSSSSSSLRKPPYLLNRR